LGGQVASHQTFEYAGLCTEENPYVVKIRENQNNETQPEKNGITAAAAAATARSFFFFLPAVSRCCFCFVFLATIYNRLSLSTLL